MNWLLLVSAMSMLSAPEGLIAYVSGSEQEDLCVCVFDMKTDQVIRVGEGARDGQPRWSPDGQWLAFPTTQPEGVSIAVVKVDGSSRRILKHQFSWNQDPQWSPDGGRLAYAASNGMTLEQRVVVYDLVKDTETVWGGELLPAAFRPVWLPKPDILNAMNSSDKVVYHEKLDAAKFFSEGFSLGVMMAVGLLPYNGRLTTEIVLVTQSQAMPLPKILMRDSLRYEEWNVEVPRKGSFVAFETNAGGDREIFVLGPRGINNITNHPSADWNPVWSQEGKWLAFESFRSGRRGLYRVFPETARVFPVSVSDQYDCWSATWAPGGDWMAFVSNRTGDPELFVCDNQGGAVRQLTKHPGPDFAPVWRPKGKK